ncbi:MAG: glutamine amidotransferase family protein [Candidatus Schekmanbacteria bacterium]|nr:glutamine amidotransferase family protein [Candidatus Schekmanbacteria bacterium]
MNNWNNQSGANIPQGVDRIFDACGIAAYINIDGRLEDGKKVVSMITTMKDRENGLGAGYAAYGLFPDYKDFYCIQLLLDDKQALVRVSEFLKTKVRIIKDEEVSTYCVPGIKKPYPLIWRFFVTPEKIDVNNEQDYMIRVVMGINIKVDGAFCMSSGKDMAVFKGNAWSDEVADFYRIQDYKAYMWLSHSRFPTNTCGWWGGAHPFNILDWSVVHNGEITSYGTNKRYLEMWEYKCTLLTDTEVVAYLFDLLVRKHKLPIYIACMAMAPPYFHLIDEVLDDKERELYNTIRRNYRPAMLNGPFSICVGSNNPVPTLIGLTDRKKLRPLVAADSKDGKSIYLASEECAIRIANDNLNEIWAPHSGNPVIVEVGKGVIWKGTETHLGNKELVITE